MEALLLETPAEQRTGFCFNRMSLQVKLGRKVRGARASAKWIGNILSRIGEAAGVKVNDRTGKCASAQDLRRTTAQDAGRLSSKLPHIPGTDCQLQITLRR